ERQYDDSLRGADGVRFVEVSALGRVVREAGAASTLAPVSGQPLRTTIDLDLQRYVAQIFPAGQRGAVLALNPNTGEILALYSAPGFDPNSFVGGIEAATSFSISSASRAVSARCSRRRTGSDSTRARASTCREKSRPSSRQGRSTTTAPTARAAGRRPSR